MAFTPFILADSIGAEGLLLIGVAYFLLPAAGVVGIEAVCLRLILPLTFRRAVKWSLATNALSALAGIPLLWFFSARFDAFVPSDLHVYFHAYLRFALLRFCIYWLISVLVEFAWALRLNTRLPVPATRRRLFLAIVLANVASYAALSAPFYLATRPHHDFQRLTANTEWSPDSTSVILFVDPASKHLCRTNPLGHPVETIVPFAMTDYQLSPDLQTCVFVSDHRLYCYRRPSATAVVRIAQFGAEWGESCMLGVTLSPSGHKVAYTVAVTKVNENGYPNTSAYSLCIFDVTTGATAIHAGLFPAAPTLAWTKDEAVLLCYGACVGSTRLVRCTFADGGARLSPVDSLERILLCPNYGTFHRRGSAWVVASDKSAQANLYATVWRTVQPQGLVISQNNPWPDLGTGDKMVTLDDNPGLPIFSFHREYSDVAFLPSSSLVLLADETFSMLYLIDPNTRTIGKLIPGRTPVLLTPKYQMTSLDFP